MMPKQTLVDKKIHGAIELTQIIMLELEILRNELRMDSQLGNIALIESIDGIMGHTTDTARTLNEIKKEFHSQLPTRLHPTYSC